MMTIDKPRARPGSMPMDTISESVLLDERAWRSLLERLLVAESLSAVMDILSGQLAPVTDAFLINLIDTQEQHLVCERIRLPAGYEEMQQALHHFKFSFSLIDINTEAYVTQQAVWVQRAQACDYPGFTSTRFERWPIESALAAPIADQKGVIGTLMLLFWDGRPDEAFSGKLQDMLAAFAAPLRRAAALERTQRLQESLEKAAGEHRQFLQFVTRVNSLSALESICDLISREFIERFGFDLVGIFTPERESLLPRHFRVRHARFQSVCDDLEAYYSTNPYRLDHADGASSGCFIDGNALFFHDARELRDLPMSVKDREGLERMRSPRTFFIVPVRQQDRSVGVLWLLSLEDTVGLSVLERELIELLGKFLGTAIANAQLYGVVERQRSEIVTLNEELTARLAQLDELASKDRLTGLANFGRFEEELQRRVEEAARARPLSLVLVEVDRFTSFNDRYGRLAGNTVLQALAERIMQAVRRMDIPCRFAGEEFAVILPRCDREGALGFVARLRKAIEHEPLPAQGGEAITVSASCASYRSGESWRQLIARADQALCAAKQAGCDQVICDD